MQLYILTPAEGGIAARCPGWQNYRWAAVATALFAIIEPNPELGCSVVPHSKTSVNADSQLLSPGQLVYLRYIRSQAETTALGICQELKSHRNLATVEWKQGLTADTQTPVVGQEVTIVIMRQGTLYTCHSTVEFITSTTPARILLVVEPECTAIHLRQHERYHALATITLGTTDDPYYFTTARPHDINVSRGGIGLALDNPRLELKQSIPFVMTLTADQPADAPALSAALRLEGRAMVRSIRKQVDNPEAYVGLQFTALADNGAEALDFWLATFQTQLRRQ